VDDGVAHPAEQLRQEDGHQGVEDAAGERHARGHLCASDAYFKLCGFLV
jgi:hypothetical protein